MKYKELLKEIDKHPWWCEDAPATIQTILYPLHCFITQSRVFHPRLLTIAISIFKGDFFYERSPEDERYEVYKYVFEKMKQDKNFLRNLMKLNFKKISVFFKEISYFIKNKRKMNNKDLCKSYTNFMNKYLDYAPYLAGIECVDSFTAYHLEDLVKKELPISDDKIKDIIFVLSSFHKLSFMEEERADFLRILLNNFENIKKKKVNSALKKQLEAHSKKYFYVLNNFKIVRYLDADYFFKKMKEEVKKDKIKLQKEFDSLKNKINNLKKKSKEIYEKYNISDDLKLHFKIVQLLGESIDDRKKNMIKANYYLELYCKEIAKRFNLDLNVVKSYTFDEIRSLLTKGKKPDKKLLEKRKKIFAYVMKRKNIHDVKVTWFYGKQAEKILEKTSAKHEDQSEIKGQVANAPVKKIKGRVQIILDVHKKKFKQGNILVTTMTRPEFVPLMRKAKAIITDEGGITCHAAILSRELNIPCIIGAKIATKVLKDGDLVEVDADKGVVRKVK